MTLDSSRARLNVKFSLAHIRWVPVKIIINAILIWIMFLTICSSTQVVRFEIPEEQPIGSLVGLLLKFIPNKLLAGPGKLFFRPIHKGHSRLFEIKPEDGRIYTAGRIDREELCPYNEPNQLNESLGHDCRLTLSVSLLRNLDQSTDIVDVIRVFISVQDIDDHSCYFTPSHLQTINLLEDAVAYNSSQIPLYSPCDLDTSPENGISKQFIQIVPQNLPISGTQQTEFPFILDIKPSKSRIKPYQLSLFLTKSLDYELVTQYRIQIEANGRDGLPSKKCLLELTINIQDVNDNPPKFSTNYSQIHIPETANQIIPIFTFSATDADSGPLYSQLLFEIDPLASDLVKSTFRIDPRNGSLFLRHSLNFKLQSEYDIPVLVYNPDPSGDNEPSLIHPESKRNRLMMDRAQLMVHVIDVNDKSPNISVYTIDGGLNLQIPEHSTDLPFDFGIMTVVDEDSGLNGKLTCQLIQESRNWFKLSSVMSNQLPIGMRSSTEFAIPNADQKEYIYKLSSIHIFDRENTSSVQMKVECHDFGSPQLTTVQSIRIEITDINDNIPKFNATEWRLAVTEDSDPLRERDKYAIAQITAVDQDIGQNARLRYRLEGQDVEKFFKVDPNTGVISSRGNLDREFKDQYNFMLIATDNGLIPLSASTLIHIFVRDYNDELPTFGEQVYEFHMMENNSPNELIGSMNAKDLDMGTNAMINFEIEPLVRSSTRYGYNRDLSTYTVPDVNKFPFEIVSYFDTIRNVYEIKLYTKSVIDREDLVSGDASEAYQSDVMDRRKPMDSNLANSVKSGYKFWIVGEDEGRPKQRARALVQIVIEDVNDNAPSFMIPKQDHWLVELSYLENVGYKLIKVIAIDKDAGQNGTVRYRLEEIKLINQTVTEYNLSNISSTPQTKPESTSSLDDLFTIHASSGSLRLKQKFQRYDIGKLFLVEIMAMDLGLPHQLFQRTTILVRVKDTQPIGTVDFDDNQYFMEAPYVSSKDGGPSLNFYIILSIILTALLISAFLIVLISVALKRKIKRQNAQKKEFEGFEETKKTSLEKQMEDSLMISSDFSGKCLQTSNTLEMNSLPKANHLTNTKLNTDSQKSVPLLQLDTYQASPYAAVGATLPSNPNSSFMHFVQLEPLTGPIDSTNLQPVKIVYPQSGEEFGSLTSQPVWSNLHADQLQETIVITSIDRPRPENVGICLSPDYNDYFVGGAQPVLSNLTTDAHITELQHVCMHPKLLQHKRNSLTSLGQDSGNGDSLDTTATSASSICATTVPKSVWLTSSSNLGQTGTISPTAAASSSHVNVRVTTPLLIPSDPILSTHLSSQLKLKQSFNLPLIHVYTPLTRVNEMESNASCSNPNLSMSNCPTREL